MIANRRWFHACPELSFQEVVTAKKVAELLRSYGITEVFEGVGRTGVVAIIRGGAGAGQTIALRADMDALPLQETGDCPFISQNKGVMHACGHDGHMSMLLGAAKVSERTRYNTPPRSLVRDLRAEPVAHAANECQETATRRESRRAEHTVAHVMLLANANNSVCTRPTAGSVQCA